VSTHACLALLLAALPTAARPAAEVAPRAAVVVGANAAVPGRQALRHAHHDAESMAEVLTAVGRFAPERVHVLRDPEPAQLLALVEREARALAGRPEAMLFFYFSGHADQASLWSGGRPVAIEALRQALDRGDVAVRIGVIDACQGGGWTRAKGLTPDAPFEVPIPRLLESEGSALIASSSGEESAHESDLLGGSFFTVHLAAGLRGAADESRDGQVTLTEAFEYARAQTIRDTARHAREPQHPSYALNLRGRQDVVLAQVAASRSALAIEQQEGPVELIHLASGLRLLELPQGPRQVTLAVPPGRYMLRRLGADGARTKEVAVPREGRAEVREGELVLVGTGRMAVKGPGPPATAPAGSWDLLLGGSASWPTTRNTRQLIQFGEPLPPGSITDPVNMAILDGRVAFTDRLSYRLGTLAFAYRLGEPGGVETIPYAGLLSWALGGNDENPLPFFRAGTGAGVRIPTGVGSLVLSGEVAAGAALARANLGIERFEAHGAAGFAIPIVAGVLDAHLAAGAGVYYYSGLRVVEGAHIPDGSRDLFWYFGSTQELGLSPLPLLRARLGRRVSIDLHGQVGRLNRPGALEPWTGKRTPSTKVDVSGWSAALHLWF